jgi:hypothetical protein
MYGMVNKAVEQLICERFGRDQWEKIKLIAGVDEDFFLSNESYPDDITYRLVAAASQVLSISPEGILEAFGEYWILNTGLQGYPDLMRSGGRTLPEFLRNLPSFHTRIKLLYPKLQPPSFAITDETATSIRLHYRTHRDGLAHFVIGLLRGLGKMFRTEVVITHEVRRGNGTLADIFLVTWTVPTI